MGVHTYGIAPASWEKLAPSLRAAIAALGGDSEAELPVMVVLRPAGPESLRRVPNEPSPAELFSDSVGTLVSRLAANGASGIRLLWLIRSISMRAPVHLIAETAGRSDVREVLLLERRQVMAPRERGDAR